MKSQNSLKQRGNKTHQNTKPLNIKHPITLLFQFWHFAYTFLEHKQFHLLEAILGGILRETYLEVDSLSTITYESKVLISDAGLPQYLPVQSQMHIYK